MVEEVKSYYEDVVNAWSMHRSCTTSSKREFLNHFGVMQSTTAPNLTSSLDHNSSKGVPKKCPLITDLPPELLELIMKKLPFDTVAKIRPVCKYFNTVASSLLNSEFSRLRVILHQRFQTIKAQMPRRESARRKHPLARESDIIETVHMRLTLLQMSFGKHIEREHCCFFAGGILDEVYRILQYVEVTPILNRAYRVTDELFDLSTMAMEYFKEHIEPSLPEISYFGADFLECSPATRPSSPKAKVSIIEDSVVITTSNSNNATVSESLPYRPSLSAAVNKKLRRMRDNIKKNDNEIIALKREVKLTSKKVLKYINAMKERNEEYNKKIECSSRKMNIILQELNHCKTELQYWRTRFPTVQCSCGKVITVNEKGAAFSVETHCDKLAEEPIVTEELKLLNDELEPFPSCSYRVCSVKDEIPCTNLDQSARSTVSKGSPNETEIYSKRHSLLKRKLKSEDIPSYFKKVKMNTGDYAFHNSTSVGDASAKCNLFRSDNDSSKISLYSHDKFSTCSADKFLVNHDFGQVISDFENDERGDFEDSSSMFKADSETDQSQGPLSSSDSTGLLLSESNFCLSGNNQCF